MATYTEEQQRIIDAPAGNILVSAAAGSGKTTVMVERIISRIRRGDVDVSGLLVLTFTDAAAANMKAKISESLGQAIRAAETSEERAYLNRQALYLPYARISTIHSFCLSVVREYAYLLDLDEDGIEAPDADFRTADQTESEELFGLAVDRVLERHYSRLEMLDAEEREQDESGDVIESSFTPEEHSEAARFRLLLDSYAGSKNDDAIRNSIREVYSFLRSMPAYRDWVEAELREVELAASDFDRSRAAATLRRRLLRAIDSQSEVLKEMETLVSDPSSEILSTKTKAGIQRNEDTKQGCLESLAGIAALKKRLLADPKLPYTEIQALLETCLFPRVTRYKEMEHRNWLSDCIRYNMSAITGFYLAHKDAPRGTLPAFAYKKNLIEEDLQAMVPVIRALFMLVLETDREYTILKAGDGVIDFNDFEHMALALLQKPEVIDLYVREITEIYVDEYQDTSSIQNSIIEAVGRDNIFVVGDVKQSIYRFRHARPELFNRKMQMYGEADSLGSVYLMSRNFRSVHGVLAAVNSLFERVMEESTGEIDYLDHHALESFHPDRQDVMQPVDFVLIDQDEVAIPDTDEDNADESSEDAEIIELSTIEEEARLIGDIIRQEGYGNGHPLAPSYGDITILCFTHSHAKAVGAELTRQGYPVSSNQDNGYLEANELRLMEALLQLVGNELQDVPLLTCLRMLPIYGRFSDRELLEMKAFSLRNRKERNPYEHYHEAVRYYLQHATGPLHEKLRRFMDWLHTLREASVYLSVEELITRIYVETALPEAVMTEEEGQLRVENLRQFKEWAADYERRGYRGLAYFVRYLEEKRKQGNTVSPFEEDGDRDDSIRVMTFHKSKGLEFPLVFLVGLNRKLVGHNRRGSSFVELSERGGIAYRIRRPDRVLSYPSIITEAQKEEMDDAAFAEALRLLYVAMTRAENKLYLIASHKRGRQSKSSSYQERLKKFANAHLAPHYSGAAIAYGRQELLLASTYSDLVFMSQIAAHPMLAEHFIAADTGESVTAGSWRFTNMATGQAWPGYEVKPVADASTPIEAAVSHEQAEETLDETAFREICAAYSSMYPYPMATRTAQKFAVSDMKRRMQMLVQMSEDMDPTVASPTADGVELGELTGGGINTQLVDWLAPEADTVAKTGLGPSERGTALHTVLRFLDVSELRGGTEEHMVEALRHFVDEGVLNDVELEAVLPYTKHLQAYVDSPIAKEILQVEAAGEQVYREVPFTLAEPMRSFASDLGPEGDDRILIQGIIDLWYGKGEDSVLLDYKSDVLQGSEEQRLRTLNERYRIQLELYSRAIYAATGRAVRRRLIWSIPDRRLYEIEAVDLAEVLGL